MPSLNRRMLPASLRTFTAAHRQLAVSLVIVCVATLISVSIFATGPDAAPDPGQEKAWPVSITRAAPGTQRPTLRAYGRVESRRVARLRSDLVAPIVQVHVSEGDWVAQGEPLVELDDREFRLRVVEREADLALHQAALASMRTQLELEEQTATLYTSRHEVARAKLKRHRDLAGDRLIARSVLDEVVGEASQASIEFRRHRQRLRNLPHEIAASEASVAKAAAQLEQARLELAKTQIVAPFPGPVLAVLAAPGDHTNLSAPLVEIADASAIEIRVQVSEHHATRMHTALNQAEPVHAVAANGETLQLNRLAGHVRSGQTATDAFFTVIATGAQPAPLGQVLSLTVQMPEEPDVIAVPVQSIYADGRVYAVVDDRLVGHRVERIGELESAEFGHRVLIRTPAIPPGTPIITTQLPRAIDGLLVSAAGEA